MIAIVRHYNAFNSRRYCDPWVAIVGPDGKPDFAERCGGYTGNRGSGEEGDLYIADPVEGTVYMFGQKDIRGKNTEKGYVQYRDGEFHEMSRADVIYHFDRMKDSAATDDVPISGISPKIRNISYSEAFSYSDIDAYISGMALSTVWCDDPAAEISAAVLSERTVWLSRLWHIANDPVRQLLGGRTMAEAAEELCMPYRTLQQWCSGDRPIAPHLRLWLATMLNYQ